MMQNIWNQNLFPTLFDYTIIIFYLAIILMGAWVYQQKKVAGNKIYKYFTVGIIVKIFGAIVLGLVYLLHYGIADTLGYYISSEALVNLLFENPNAYFKILWGGLTPELANEFTQNTGYPWYRGDSSSFLIVRITSIFTFLGFKNYFTASILFASFFFTGYWKLFKLFCHLYPKYHKEFFVAVFLFPSVLFWGSGILKDTITLSTIGWFLSSLHGLFLKKEKMFMNAILSFLTAIIIVSIKAYVLVALIPGVFIWLGWSYISKVKNILVRLLFGPAVVLILLGVAVLFLQTIGGYLGAYGSVEGVISKAIITYEDHSRAIQYGENFYDLGEFDGTIGNFVSKAPQAITAGLFRPFIWEVRNVLMLLAALENLILLFLVAVIFWRVGFIKAFKIGFDEPLVIFSLSFAIVFAFAVGVSTANFGALVRLKTPMLPFFAAALAVMYHRSLELKIEKEKQNRAFFKTSASEII